MLTKIIIRNFKKFQDVEVPLGNGFVFIGPNNSGKTSALQALALWDTCLQKLLEKRGGDQGMIPPQPRGITINRKDLVFSPVAHSNSLWLNRKVGSSPRVILELIVCGADDGKEWQCGLELEYINEESVHCRPLRTGNESKDRMPIPKQVKDINIVMLPPMSGLADEEPLVQPGRINVLLGQGRTAEVLRNICYGLWEKQDGGWMKLREHLHELFGISPEKPVLNAATGAIEINYRENRNAFDLQSVGRGAQQVMLILAFLLYHKEGTVFLFDEPDAHLEILRQDAIYQLFESVAGDRNSQIIVASHSEKLLDSAARNDTVVSFVGAPKMLSSDKVDEVKKSLTAIGWDVYYQAERNKKILYLEGPSDRTILENFARRLEHPAANSLRNFYCRYVRSDRGLNKFGEFAALKEALPKLRGLILMDKRPGAEPPEGLRPMSWSKCEIENYICTRNTLLAYASAAMSGKGSNDTTIFSDHFRPKMEEAIEEMENSLKITRETGLFDDNSKASKNLETLLGNFSKKVGIQPLAKKDFYQLVKFVPQDELDPEIEEKLDAIAAIAKATTS